MLQVREATDANSGKYSTAKYFLNINCQLILHTGSLWNQNTPPACQPPLCPMASRGWVLPSVTCWSRSLFSLFSYIYTSLHSIQHGFAGGWIDLPSFKLAGQRKFSTKFSSPSLPASSSLGQDCALQVHLCLASRRVCLCVFRTQFCWEERGRLCWLERLRQCQSSQVSINPGFLFWFGFFNFCYLFHWQWLFSLLWFCRHWHDAVVISFVFCKF